MESFRWKHNSQGSPDEGPAVKKRHRVAIVCLNCRKKKIKCDKKKPSCENCVKTGLTCLYQDLVWASSTTVDDQGKVSNYTDFKGNHTDANTEVSKDPSNSEFTFHEQFPKEHRRHKLYDESSLPADHPLIDPTEQMDFFEGTISTDEIVRSGPFSWLIFASKDLFIKFLWVKASLKKQRKMLYLDANIGEDEQGKDEKVGKDEKRVSKLRWLKPKSHLPSYQPLTFEIVHDLVLKNLPTKKVLWILLPRFYNYIFPYLSYLDWDRFVSDIKESLSTSETDFTHEKFQTLNLKNESALCHIATLFIVLRLAYLSLMEEPESNEFRQYVLLNPVQAESVHSTQILLNQFNVFEKPPLELLEAYIYVRAYHHYSPEQGDNTGYADSSVFNGLIVSVAVSLGLHRDPGSFEQFKYDVENCNLRRRLWNFVSTFDLYLTVSLGRPAAYNFGISNVQIPKLQGTDLNSRQNILTLTCQEYCAGYDIISQTAAILTDPNSTNIYKLVQGVKKVDELRTQKFKSLTEIFEQKIDPNSPPHITLRRVVQFVRYVFLNTFCFTIEYNIFLHYENEAHPNSELATYYLSKILKRSNETMNNLPNLITNASNYFGYGFDLVQFPATLLSLHKALQVQTSLSLRCQHMLKLMKLKKNSPMWFSRQSEYKKIQRYLKLIIKSISSKLENYLKNLDTACKTYQYAWRLKRPHTLFWVITNQECFEIKDGEIVMLERETLEEFQVKVSQNNILEDMSLEELKTMYPLSNEEIHAQKPKLKLELYGEVLDQTVGSSPSAKSERSPSISNLINHEDQESSSISSPAFLKSPHNTAFMDPDVDKNWIKLLYAEDNTQMQFAPVHFDELNDLTTRQKDVQFDTSQQQFYAPQYYNPQAPVQATSQTSIQATNQAPGPGPGPSQTSSQTPSFSQPINPPPVTNANAQTLEYSVPTNTYNQLVQQPFQFQTLDVYQPRFSQSNIPQQYMPLDTSRLQTSMPNQQYPPQNDQNMLQQSNFLNTNLANMSQNTLHEFFGLIGAGGFNNVDEMFGSPLFYDRTM